MLVKTRKPAQVGRDWGERLAPPVSTSCVHFLPSLPFLAFPHALFVLFVVDDVSGMGLVCAAFMGFLTNVMTRTDLHYRHMLNKVNLDCFNQSSKLSQI